MLSLRLSILELRPQTDCPSDWRPTTARRSSPKGERSAPSTRPFRDTTLQGGRAPRSPASDGSCFGTRKGPPPRVLERNASLEDAPLTSVARNAHRLVRVLTQTNGETPRFPLLQLMGDFLRRGSHNGAVVDINSAEHTTAGRDQGVPCSNPQRHHERSERLALRHGRGHQWRSVSVLLPAQPSRLLAPYLGEDPQEVLRQAEPPQQSGGQLRMQAVVRFTIVQGKYPSWPELPRISAAVDSQLVPHTDENSSGRILVIHSLRS